MDALIRRTATGTPGKLAKRLGMSCSSMHELIRFLRDEMKAPIVYSRYRESYLYEYPPKFYLGFEREHLSHGEMVNSSGGAETGFEQETLNPAEMTGTYGGGGEKKKKKKVMVEIEIEIDDDACILDNDIDFNDLYH
jgi:hypothetical protein